mmetsp:Transcript_14981/g.14997  ORF Transcript_14981/g.14997 Transcript_14981/m.14997 type:complete len:121 (-) Transcript_14981:39-401(-)
MKENWDFKTFDCLKNPIMCLWAFCVPCGDCCMQSCNAKITEPENPNAGLYGFLLPCCLGVCGAAFNRYKLRHKMNIEGAPIMDCVCHCCCSPCSVIQEWMHVMKHKRGDEKITILNLNTK